MVEATGLSAESFCLACYNGDYPIEPDRSFNKHAFGGGCSC
jgi:amidophosphoribosyltransferase